MLGVLSGKRFDGGGVLLQTYSLCVRLVRIKAGLLFAAWFICGWTLVAGDSGDFLRWRSDRGRVDASIHAWSLDRVLESLARSAGWEVLVEPDTSKRISAKFEDLPRGAALRLLLGDLNYAIVPRPGAVDKLVIYRTDAGAATRRIKAFKEALGEAVDGGPRQLVNELVVKAKKGADVEALARKLGAQIVGSMDEAGLYRLRFEDEAAAKLGRGEIAQSDEFDSEANYAVPRPPRPESLPAGSALPFTLNPSPPVDGAKLVVGLIDTPVQREGGRLDEFLLPAISLAGEAALPGSEPTHGTSMAETVLRGIALSQSGESSAVRILPVDVYGAAEITSTFDVAQGISGAIEAGANFVNLSLGGTGDTEYLHALIRNSAEKGVVFFASAGNQPVTTPVFPAAYPEVIAVTAGDRNGELASYANRGEFVDVIAPGGNIVSYGGASFLVSGTSPASAFAAGMAVGTAEQNGGSAKVGVERLREAFEFKQP